MIANAVATDRRLSFGAAGLLIHLLSKPDNWSVSVAALSREAQEGRDKIYGLLNELIKLRYARRTSVRDDNGKMLGTDYEIFDAPLPENPEVDGADYPLPENPDTVFPDTDSPYTDFPTLQSKEYTKKPSNKVTSVNAQKRAPEKPGAIDSAFDRFWSAGLPKVGKQKAHAAFLANLKKSKRDAESFAELLAEDIEHRLLANQFGFDRLHPTTYLNQRRWEDERPEIIPFDRIVESYHRSLPNNVPVTALSDRRREFLTYLWTQRANRDLDWFDEFFAFCASQQWLNGVHWADLEWLTDPNHYPRITENAKGAAA
ncbi:hypothetical protein [Microbulbifer sp. 2304DJ12-6]|uniref:hypothetical protein n=1 Tax=Microbulbifer sp. 2304DJ12-6 TaxID=3233340 RepID=UPI0039B0D3F4